MDKKRPGMVCWSCKYFNFDNGSPGYSEWTPGWSAKMWCSEGIWEFDFEVDDAGELQPSLQKAENCEEFEGR